MIPTGSSLRVLLALLRWPALIAFSGGGIFLAAGLAGRARLTACQADLVLLALAVVLLHGVVSHALNDCTDWLSGTDTLSPGLLSGGSRVIPRRLTGPRELIRISAAALVLAVFLSCWLVVRRGPGVFLPLTVGLWSSLAYSLPPLRLAYRPLAGEWLAAFPALLACILGAYWILTGKLNSSIWLAALIYSLLGQAWFTEHHLADVAADLAAQPRKLTTVAWVSLAWGRPAARFVPALYALAALPVVGRAAQLWGKRFWLAGLPALISAAFALTADPADARATTRAELAMMALTLVQAVLLVLLF